MGAGGNATYSAVTGTSTFTPAGPRLFTTAALAQLVELASTAHDLLAANPTAALTPTKDDLVLLIAQAIGIHQADPLLAAISITHNLVLWPSTCAPERGSRYRVELRVGWIDLGKDES